MATNGNASKPVTYPQQIQDLKNQLEQRDEQIKKLMEARDTIPLLNDEIGRLTGELTAKSKKDSQQTGATKAQQTDLLQRAESAENAARIAKNAALDKGRQVAELESQLDLLGKNEFKVKDLESKISLLSGELQTKNSFINSIQQRHKDTVVGLNAQLEQQAKTIRDMHMVNVNSSKVIDQYRQAGDERVGPLLKQKEIDDLTIADLMTRLDATNKAYSTLKRDAQERIKSLETQTEQQAKSVRELIIKSDRYEKMVNEFRTAVANSTAPIDRLKEILG